MPFWYTGFTNMPFDAFICAPDEAIGRVKDACDQHGYVMMVTADHGNAEQMISEKGGPHTAHTTYRGRSLKMPTQRILVLPFFHRH